MRSQMKESIADAFVTLAKKKSIDKITVKDLVDYCGISRQSFYYHFQDILEVIEWQAQRMEEEFSIQVQKAGSFEEAAELLAKSVIDSRDLSEKLRESQKRDFVEKLVMDSMEERFRETARRAAMDAPLPMTPTEADALIRFFTFGLAGLMMAHCYEKEPDAKVLSRQIIAVFRYLVPSPEERK